MANPNLNDVMEDPDFWDERATDETRKWALSQVDKKFAGYGKAEQDRTMTNMMKTYKDTQKRQMEQRQGSEQTVAPQAQEHQQNKTLWEQAVAPLTEAVGRGIETATSPMVGLARMAKGEGLGAALGPETFSASHPSTANQVASNVVPQSPWQAGAMGAQFIPGVGSLGALGRVGAAAGGAGALQGLLGSEGILEGGTTAQAAGEAGLGALKGATTQGGGEVLGKVLGGARRATGAIGLTESTGAKDVRRITDTARQLSPELNPGKGAGKAGEFFVGSKGAEKAAGGAYSAKMQQLEQALVKETGQPYIKSPDLGAAYGMIMKKYGKNPNYVDQLAALKPNQGGFLPEQAKDILALTRDMMKLDATATGSFNQTALNNLVTKIEASLPQSARGILTAGREGYARASGISELLGGSIKTGNRGYALDSKELQSKVGTSPELAERIGPDALAELVKSATRGAGKGFSDVKSGGGISYPYHLAPAGISFAALRNFLTRNRMVGKHPQALEQGTKAGLGVATTATAGQREKKD